MIYTCTLNPSIDYLVQADQIELGTLNRAKNVSFYPGGKGINVSRVLKNLGVNSTALGCLGGFTGEFICNELSTAGISHDFIQLEEPTRVNIKLQTGEETEINGLGANIPQSKQEEFLQKFQAITHDDYVVLAGSLPPTVSLKFYEDLASYCNKQNIRFVVDTSGESLENLLKYKPFLIKPNQHELGELLNKDVVNVDDALLFGKELLKKGPQNIIVSMGSEGAIFINNDMTAYARVPKGNVRSTVGAGDSTVAGFLAEFAQSRDYLTAFKYGVAAGTATAFSSDLCLKSSVDEVLSEIKIEVINRGMPS